jgi:hypothetical protein
MDDAYAFPADDRSVAAQDSALAAEMAGPARRTAA